MATTRCSVDRHRERRGVDRAPVPEVEEEPVAAGSGELGAEGDLRPGSGVVLRVDVQVAEVAVAQRDQVSVGTEVGLQVGDRLPVAASPSR